MVESKSSRTTPMTNKSSMSSRKSPISAMSSQKAPKQKRPERDATKYFIGQYEWWDKCMMDGVMDACKIPLLTPKQDPNFLMNGRIQ